MKKITIFYTSILLCLSFSVCFKVKNRENEGNKDLEDENKFDYKSLFENAIYEKKLLEEQYNKLKLENDNLKEALLGHNQNLNKDNKVDSEKSISSFLEMKSQTTTRTRTGTDPAFKTFVEFVLPNDTSFKGLPGERNNKEFRPYICPLGCVVGNP